MIKHIYEAKVDEWLVSFKDDECTAVYLKAGQKALLFHGAYKTFSSENKAQAFCRKQAGTNAAWKESMDHAAKINTIKLGNK
jgi:hypothetical protein